MIGGYAVFLDNTLISGFFPLTPTGYQSALIVFFLEIAIERKKHGHDGDLPSNNRQVLI
jgi:hypothetical protein